MKEYLENFENCMEKEIPYCIGDCPFNMEILNFMEKAARGSMKAAFKVHRNATGFPRIANALCDAPCRKSCPLGENGDAVRLDLLEKTALELTADTSATDYNIPPKKEKIAIVGAGLSGMAALLRLSTKKYTVELFEKSSRTGGHLWETLEPETFQRDFEEQLAHQDYALHLDKEIKSLSELSGFDAVYIATGKGGQDFGLLGKTAHNGDRFCMEQDGTGYFAGGELIGNTPLHALAGGLAVGTVIDNYLKTGSLYYPKGHKKTRMCIGMIETKNPSPAVPASGDCYTKEEAIQEASRCVKCHCSACRDHCDLLEFTEKQPIRVRDEIVATTLEGKSELKATPAKRLMSMCNQCGICKEVCPEDIDLDGLFLVGRQKMHKQGKMPWPYHDFWLRDMAQADSEEAALVRKPKGREQEPCGYALFPGCQLGASEPELIVKLYDALLNQHPDTAMFLQCCGVPILWAGDKERFDGHMAQMRQAWEDLGRPAMIMACPTCMKHWKAYLPEASVVSLPELLRQWDISGGCHEGAYAVFDPCSARSEDGMRQAVRKLAQDLGVSLIPLPDNNKYFTCCGYGGHGDEANPDYAEFVAKKRVSESDAPYITYCINCRDAFLKRGKNAFHILELIFGEGNSHQHFPTVTERQENRRILKETLLEFFWEEPMEIKRKEYPITVEISPELKEKLDKERILEGQVCHAIDFCQRHGRTILDTETGNLSGYCPIGYMTYWVTYKAVDEAAGKFELVNAYSHRTKIELEAVWNGVKQDIDLQ